MFITIRNIEYFSEQCDCGAQEEQNKTSEVTVSRQ